VREQNVDQWMEFFAEFGLPTAFERQPRERLDGSLRIVLETRSEPDPDEFEGYPVISRVETIDTYRTTIVQVQSALSMPNRTYDGLDLEVVE
jgi:hypothetical protein